MYSRSCIAGVSKLRNELKDDVAQELKDLVRRTLMELREAEAGERADQIGAAFPLTRLTLGAPQGQRARASKEASGACK